MTDPYSKTREDEHFLEEKLFEWEALDPRPEATTFCKSFGVTDPNWIARFKRRAAALAFMSGFLENDADKVADPLRGREPRLTLNLEIAESIGQGGRSRIYRALEPCLNRDLALKTTIPGAIEQVDYKARLIQEAKILGHLQHPGILPVYHLFEGDSSSNCFYTMPLVKGQTLRQAIEQSGRESSKKKGVHRNALLRRFMSVCQTAAYAHSRGVVHRDIKPDNILLGPFGETFLVDWGLARIRNDSKISSAKAEATLATNPGFSKTCETVELSHPHDLTREGATLGTPAFMSPEQANSDPDCDPIASEVFNLGATLYNLLTGQAPYRHASITEIVKLAKQTRFPRPRELNPQIPRPLESVCLKAMCLQPQERYESAADMAKEIGLWLDDQPIPAHRESFLEKWARWNRRNGRWIAAALIGMVVLSTTVVLSAISIQRQKSRADEQAALAWQTVSESVNEIEQDEMLKTGHLRPLRRRLLQSLLKKYDRLLDASGNASLAKTEVARLYFQSGRLNSELGNFQRADRVLKISSQLLEDSEQKETWMLVQFWLMKQATDLQELRALVQQADEKFKQSDSRDRSQELLEAYLQIKLLHAREELNTGDLAKARQYFRAIRQSLDEWDVDQISKLKIQGKLLELSATLQADRALQNQVLEEAITNYEAILESTDLSADDRLLTGNQILKTLRMRIDRSDSAQEEILWQQRRQFWLKQQLNEFPSISEYRRMWVEALIETGKLARRQEKFLLAYEQFELADEQQQPELKARTFRLKIEALMDLANEYRAQGQTELSNQKFRQANRWLSESKEQVPSTTLRTMGQNLLILGSDQWTYGDSKGAKKTFEDAHRYFRQCLQQDPTHSATRELQATSRLAIGLADALLGNGTQAISQIRRAIQELEQLRPDSNQPEMNWKMAMHVSHFLLAATLENTGQSSRARQIQERMSEFEPATGPSLHQLARTYALESQAYGRGKERYSKLDRFYRLRYERQVIQLLTRAKSKGVSIASWANDPAWAPLYRHPEFRELLDQAQRE